MSIEAGLWSLLVNDAEVALEVDDRVYPVVLPQPPTYPAVTYRRISQNIPLAHDGPVAFSADRFQVDCYAEEIADLVSVVAAVRTCLNGYSGTSVGVKIWCIKLLNQVNGFGEAADVMRSSIDFLVTYRVG